MEERSYPPSDTKAPDRPRTRLLPLIFIIILVAVFVPILISVSPFEPILLSLFIFIPMIGLLLIVLCRCCMGRSLDDIGEDQEARIFESMRLHAAPAEHIADLDRYRCPECEMSFELKLAEPVDENIVLCPICKTRLFIE